MKKIKKEDIIASELSALKHKYNLSNDELLSYLDESLIPISIFNTKLAPLQALVKYLKENLNYNYNKISKDLNRNYQTIRTTYITTPKIKISISSKFFISLSLFKKNKFSILETLVSYLKDSKSLSFHNIAKILNRDDRTIWTCYHRYETKKQNEK